ncbi:MAG: hypothetical protein WA160_06485 [Pseudobdellovibrio sp.]
MSSPIFLDTGLLIAHCSNNKTEANRVLEAEKIFQKNPHSSRHTVEPCLVELFYKVRKHTQISPKDVKTHLNHWAVTPFPVDASKILEKYLLISHKAQFDFADFYLCCAALHVSRSIILTIDRNDFPLALSYAQKSKLFPESNVVQLIPLM